MKFNIKFLVILLCFQAYSFLYSGTKTSDVVPETMRGYYHFEIFNKSGKVINFVLEDENSKNLSNDMYSKQIFTTIADNKKLRLLNIDPKASYLISIQPFGASKTLKFIIEPNNTRKNIFLTWDDRDIKKEYLRPQSGPLKGLMGKTESGLPLGGNIKQADIDKKSSF